MYKNVHNDTPDTTFVQLCQVGPRTPGQPVGVPVVASQWAGGAVRENEVLFSVFFVLWECILDSVPYSLSSSTYCIVVFRFRRFC